MFMVTVHDPLSVTIGVVVSNVLIVSKCVAKYGVQNNCVTTLFCPSPAVSVIPVSVPTPSVFLKLFISPKSE